MILVFLQERRAMKYYLFNVMTFLNSKANLVNITLVAALFIFN